MTLKTLDRYIESTPGIKSGKHRIAGHRITVQNIVVWHEWLGLSADEIASEHNLPLAAIYAALAFYYDHQEEIDLSIETESSFVESLRSRIASKLSKKLDG
jgi:uncharacterized protein (DUF433 family)